MFTSCHYKKKNALSKQIEIKPFMTIFYVFQGKQLKINQTETSFLTGICNVG